MDEGSHVSRYEFPLKLKTWERRRGHMQPILLILDVIVFGDKQFEAMVPLDHGRREIEEERDVGVVVWVLGCEHEL
jgi:hypothetical protein